MDGIVHGITKSRTQLNDFHFHFLSLSGCLWCIDRAHACGFPSVLFILCSWLSDRRVWLSHSSPGLKLPLLGLDLLDLRHTCPTSMSIACPQIAVSCWKRKKVPSFRTSYNRALAGSSSSLGSHEPIRRLAVLSFVCPSLSQLYAPRLIMNFLTLSPAAPSGEDWNDGPEGLVAWSHTAVVCRAAELGTKIVHLLPSQSLYCLLHDSLINWEMSCWSNEQPLFNKPADQRDGGLMSKRTSLL